MEEYKSISKYLNKKKPDNEMARVLKRLISKILICLILFMAFLITIKVNVNLKDTIYKKVYDDNLSFTTINQLYNRYLGDIFPLDNFLVDATPVFSEKLVYKEINVYKDGAKLTVGKDYLVPALDDGIVTFIGKKDGYGNTVIVQQNSGIDLWYANIEISNIKMYDYVKSGTVIGQTTDEFLYLVFKKDGKVLNYKEYI